MCRCSLGAVASPSRRPVRGAVVVISAAAPFLGANVGVAIWSAAFIVAWSLVNKHRLTWKTVLVALVIMVLLISAFAAIDVLGHGAKTHLARSLASAQQGGVVQLWLIVVRKAQTNARVFPAVAGDRLYRFILAVHVGLPAAARCPQLGSIS